MSNKKNVKNNNDKKKLGIVLAIVMAIAMVAGGTYAFWLWRGNITNLNVTVTIPSIGVELNGGATTISGLAPANCKHSRFAVNSPITIKRYNESNYPAYVVFKLSLDSFTWTRGTSAPNSTALGNIRFAVSSLPSASMNSSCSDAGVLANTTSNGTTEILTYNPQITVSTGQYIGSLSGINAGTLNTPVTGQNKKLLTWIYEIPANSGTESSPITETYYIYYWIDSGYTGVAGSPAANGSGAAGIVDPLQDATFTVKWAAGGNIIQVENLSSVSTYTGA